MIFNPYQPTHVSRRPTGDAPAPNNNPPPTPQPTPNNHNELPPPKTKGPTINLPKKHLKQVTSYAIDPGCEWRPLTNSREWKLHHVTFGQPPKTNPPLLAVAQRATRLPISPSPHLPPSPPTLASPKIKRAVAKSDANQKSPSNPKKSSPASAAS